jgi:hypothetical protein
MKPIVATFLLFLIFTACGKNNTDRGPIITKTREIPDFTSLMVVGDYIIYAEQDSISEVKIEAETEVIQGILTEVINGELIITDNGALANDFPINIYIKSPVINALTHDGRGSIEKLTMVGDSVFVTTNSGGTIRIKIVAEKVFIQNNGTGLFTIDVESQLLQFNSSSEGYSSFRGNSKYADFKLTNQGTVSAFDLEVSVFDLINSGVGFVQVNVSDSLNAVLMGSGSLYYMGDPVLDTTILGYGTINHQP